MKPFLALGMALKLSISALAMPYAVDFAIAETDPRGAINHVLSADSSSRMISTMFLPESSVTDSTPSLSDKAFVLHGTAPGLPASLTFNLTDSQNGGTFGPAAVAEPPELDWRSGASAAAMLLGGCLLLASRRVSQA